MALDGVCEFLFPHLISVLSPELGPLSPALSAHPRGQPLLGREGFVPDELQLAFAETGRILEGASGTSGGELGSSLPIIFPSVGPCLVIL